MISELFKQTAHGGYRRTSHLLNRGFNLIVALILLVVTAPLFALLYLVILLSDGRPVFYSGVRLGMNKRRFVMYKFRTLVRDAESVVGTEVLTERHKLTTAYGKFLRDTRLDELPQLYNVLRGDMDLVGPRPERPNVYERICSHIHNYDLRFGVNPGMIGFSQLFTPHGTPKRLRVIVDNKLVRRKQILFWDMYAVVFTGVVVAKTTVVRMARLVGRALRSRILRQYNEKRELERVPGRCTRVSYATAAAPERFEEVGVVIDINAEAFLFHAATPLASPFPKRFKLRVELSGWLTERKRRHAICEGELYRGTPVAEGGINYVIRYRPVSPLNYYMIHQYFLRESVA